MFGPIRERERLRLSAAGVLKRLADDHRCINPFRLNIESSQGNRGSGHSLVRANKFLEVIA
jgi:hypothetical protein